MGPSSAAPLGALAALLAALPAAAQLPPTALRVDPVTQWYQALLGRDGDTLHLVGTESTSSSGVSVRYSRSTDAGRTWSICDQQLGSNTFASCLAVVGSRVFVACDNGGFRNLLASYDGGGTWQSALVLPTGSGAVRIHGSGSVVNALCVGSGYASTRGVYLVRSLDGGVTWTPPVDLSIGLPTSSSATETALQIVANGATIHVFWNHRTPTLHLAHQRSLDGGATWLPAAQWLANAPLVGAGLGAGRLLVQAGSTLWTSTNDGATWSPLPGHGLAFPISLAMDGAEVLAIEAAPTTPPLLRTASSSDAGLTWTVAATTFPADSATVVEASVCGQARFVRHFVTGGNPGDMVLEQSDDGGATWRTVLGGASAGFLPGRDGGLVLTQDANSAGMWAWVLEGHTRYGTGNAGTGGAVPTLSGRGLAGLGHTFRLELANACGGSLAAFVLGFSYGTGPFLGPHTRLWLLQPVTQVMALTTGAPGQRGVGTASHSVLVPNSVSFVGLMLASQCFVVDPGAPDGFCATESRQSWIR